MKTKTIFVCTKCGATHPKWQGQCAGCEEWNSLEEASVPRKGTQFTSGYGEGYSGALTAITRLSEVKAQASQRTSTGMAEFDRVLGGGLVPGSVVLMGGDPGAGKSTLLLQMAGKLASREPCLYVSGEESIQQIAGRAVRLGMADSQINLASLTSVGQIAEVVQRERPEIVVIDSIQVVHADDVESVPGSVTQVRECAARLTRLAKQQDCTFVLVGHVTKEGNLAGPKVLEHIIDCFVMLDSPPGSRYRTLRGVKNRFGAVNELGVFAMTDKGLREVLNPSAIFLERSGEPAAGSVVTVTWEGTRPLLVEIQALVDDVQGGYPRRVAVGLDAQRLAMHLAIMHRHCGVSLADQDVFANVTGGVRVGETAVDLALLVAVYSSFRNRPLPRDLVVFGELGLTGEIRPVPNGQERIHEVQKHGFTRVLAPTANRAKRPIAGIEVAFVKTLSDALDTLSNMLG
ncbi:MAG: DNA repair protein RadA [Gammaproteobacteria bacterium]|nr:DNA repair protein RadA [Gammaproteobacteria bacterium]